jgi:glutathione S-transferase
LNDAIAETAHLAGKTFTLADMYLMPILAYLRMFPESGKIIAKADHLVRYFATHSTRDSFVNTIPPPLAELRG